MDKEKRNKGIIFLIFSILLIIFAYIARKVSFHDSIEYISVSKALADYQNVDLFVGHTIVYPYFVSFFLKIFPTLLTIRIINVFWIIAIAAIFYFFINNKKAFWIFAFSPLVWFVSIQTTPVLPASFFILLSFVLYKKEDLKYRLIYSGISLGLACAIYLPVIIFTFIFVIVYFWQKTVKETFVFLISLLAGFSITLIIDFIVFKMPFYSLIRFFGTNLLMTLGLRDSHGALQSFANYETLLLFVFLSPLIYKLYKLEFGKYKKEIILIFSVIAIFYLREALIKYSLLLFPIIILLLVKVFDDKDVKIHSAISSIIIAFILFSNISYTGDVYLEKDIKNIVKETNSNYFIVEDYNAAQLSVFIWDKNPKFEWEETFNSYLENKTAFKKYNFKIGESDLELRDNILFEADFMANHKNYGNYTFIAYGKDFKRENFNLIKCYNILCTYNHDIPNNSSA